MSYSVTLDKKRRTYVRMIGQIQHALNLALSEEHDKRGLTRAEIARILNKNKSFITRKFSGEGNMTLETLADLAYALDRPVKVSLPSRDTAISANRSHTPPITHTSSTPPAHEFPVEKKPETKRADYTLQAV